ncbi:hypothetical protein Y1Q_0021745 [Alligator mississippiensis]|uniref:Uncharacterized protein n=1 Tax=Alligator mississippiensis TaxID=8496 RepID=A0A151PAS7_ALLMI|nr:hypothetical protein Y1Q_0021745 [Alligator mississippiensis]
MQPGLLSTAVESASHWSLWHTGVWSSSSVLRPGVGLTDWKVDRSDTTELRTESPFRRLCCYESWSQGNGLQPDPPTLHHIHFSVLTHPRPGHSSLRLL